MAMQKLLFAKEYPTDADIKRILTEETTIDSYNVQEGGLIINQQFADKRTLKLINYHNSFIAGHNHTKLILGQLGLKHRVTEYKKTKFSSKSDDNPRVTDTHHPIPGPWAPRNDDVQGKEGFSNNLISRIPTRNTILNGNHMSVYPYKSRFSLMNSAETNDQLPLPIAQLNPSRELKMQGHESINQIKPHGLFVCVKCEEKFVTTLCYEAHMRFHYEAEKLVESIKRKESMYREMPGKDQGISLYVNKGWNPIVDINTEAAVKKEPIDYGFEMAVGEELCSNGVVIKKEPY